MKSETPVKLQSAGFFVMRTPLLPFNELASWADGLAAHRVGDDEADATLAEKWLNDCEILRERLKRLIERPEVQVALFVASPSLHAGIAHWRKNPLGKKGLQAERSLVRYFSRMSSRPTPFGLFSGCSLGIVDPSESVGVNLELDSRTHNVVHSRLDFDYLFALTDHLRRELIDELQYRPNSSLCKSGDVWNYIESRLADGLRTRHLVKLVSDQYLDAVIERSGTGADIRQLAEAIQARAENDGISSEECNTFVRELIDNNVLVSSFSPAVTGEPALEDLIRQLDALPSARLASDALKSVADDLAQMNRKGMAIAPDEYRGISATIDKLSVKVDISRPYQVDMIKPVRKAVLSKAVVDEIANAVDILLRIGSPKEPDTLRSFREAFLARYQRARVPLLEALDQDSGIGFGPPPPDSSPLLRGLRIGGEDHGAPVSLDTLLLRKMKGNAPGEESELLIDEAELPPRDAGAPGAPASFAVEAILLASSPEAVERGDYRVILGGAHGPSGARMFGRFCHADTELARHVREYLRQEESADPDAVYAEVVYVPEGRVGNVLCRPVVREYEIVYLGRSGAPEDHQLPVSDLLVSVEGNEIVLHSRRLGRRIIPRMTNAHTYIKPELPAVYRFLCSLQDQHGASVPPFSWGSLSTLDFQPRVRIGRVILARARWRLRKDEIEQLTGPRGYQRYRATQQLRARRQIPRWVVLEEFDHTLPVDFDNPLSVDAFVHALGRRQQGVLREMWAEDKYLPVSSPEGRFQHELIVPFLAQSRPEREEGGRREVSPAFLARISHAGFLSRENGTER